MTTEKWVKTTKGNTIDEFLIEKTGHTAAELTAVKPHYLISKIQMAADMINKARDRGQKISLVADYDSDGINSALIMSYIFMMNKNRFELIMPKRESEGYGLSDKIMDRIDPNNMIVTIDNGIKAIDQIKRAKQQGMEVLILDHHEAGEKLPPADVIIDPSAIGEAEYTYYCGAGLAFKLAEWMFGVNHPMMPLLSAYAAIGTIGDCVELTGDNRRIVMKGLAALKNSQCSTSLHYLWEKSRMSESSTAMDVSFNIVPVLNAPGRLYDDGAKIPVQALFKTGALDEKAIANVDRLLKINQERKNLVKKFEGTIDIDEIIKNGERGVVYYDETIPLGIAGILAGNIAEKTGRPAIVLSDDANGLLKGSVRNPDDRINIVDILSSMNDLLTSCGGHKKAAGISLERRRLNEFRTKFLEALPEPVIQTGITYDLDIMEKDFLNVAEQILSLEPCGEGLPAPKVRVRARLKKNKNGQTYMLMGKEKDHVKFFCEEFDAVAFYQAETLNQYGLRNFQYIDMVGRVTENIFNGNRSIKVVVEDFTLN